LFITILPYVNPNPSISLLTDSTNVCFGSVVNLQVGSIISGGTNPIVNWLINGVDIGYSGNIYSTNSLSDGDVVSLMMYPNNVCQLIDSAESNLVIFQVGVLDTYYADLDNDGLGNILDSLNTCFQPVGYVPTPGDCDDTDAAIQLCSDADGDGYTDNVDCDDTNPNINPGAQELCGNQIDENCDGMIYQVWYWDGDNDGFATQDSVFYSYSCDTLVGFVINPTIFDCNDANDAVYPGATEICDGLDNDCNSFIDDGAGVWWFYDGDLDGFGTIDSVYFLCYEPSPYWTTNATDCDDTNPLLTPISDNDGDGYLGCVNDCDDFNPAVSPIATEVCDSIDNDCDGLINEGVGTIYYADADGDGYGNSDVTVASCDVIPPVGYVADSTDCLDNDSNAFPTAIEICGNDIDENCDGILLNECIEDDPDGFSPNDDGQGDEFVLDIGERDTRFKMEVYNRWGTKVYESSSQGRLVWDGRPNFGREQEKYLPVGTYFAIIEINGEVKRKTITIWK
jgi:gliding motility-associated-like protein